MQIKKIRLSNYLIKKITTLINICYENGHSNLWFYNKNININVLWWFNFGPIPKRCQLALYITYNPINKMYAITKI